MTIRKERRRLEKRLKRSLLAKRVDDGYNCGSRFNDCTNWF